MSSSRASQQIASRPAHRPWLMAAAANRRASHACRLYLKGACNACMHVVHARARLFSTLGGRDAQAKGCVESVRRLHREPGVCTTCQTAPSTRHACMHCVEAAQQDEDERIELARLRTGTACSRRCSTLLQCMRVTAAVLGAHPAAPQHRPWLGARTRTHDKHPLSMHMAAHATCLLCHMEDPGRKHQARKQQALC